MRRMWFGWIEEPFPWLLLGLVTVCAVAVEAVVAFSVLTLFDCNILEEF